MESKLFFFDGSILVSSGTITFKNKDLSIVGFTQTDTQRIPGEEYTGEEVKPELIFVFESIESVDAVIKVLNHTKNKLIKKDLTDKEK